MHVSKTTACLSFPLSVSMEQLNWLCGIVCTEFLPKSCQRNSIFAKIWQKETHFAWRPKKIYCNILLNASWVWKGFRKKFVKKIKAHLISNIFFQSCCVQDSTRNTTKSEAKEIVDLKIWHHTDVIYMLDNFGKNRNTQSDLWSDDENHETMQQITCHYDLFSSLTALCLHSRPWSNNFPILWMLI